MQALDDLPLLIDAARRAGDIARKFWRHDPKAWHKADDAGPVTEADMAVNNMLFADLMAARPDYGWLSEETLDTDARLTKDRVFIIDPIDGTRSFIEGDHNWAHSLAIAEHGEIIAGVVYLPIRDRLFAAAKGQGASLNSMPLKCDHRKEIDGARVLTHKHNMDPKLWNGGCPDFVPKFRSSLAYRTALVGQGRFDAMISLRNTWEWDVAAGSLIAQEAGAKVIDHLGAPLSFNKPTPAFAGFIAANRELATSIVQRLAITS
ncbi:myo-inositol-1(or 4)-monophosphatase [Pacificibacter maritimus]|uniref:Myo-inositol-1(Or 4)-monophosphatase n=1 Tax=Pacificibacter maritimus TaxID=762213 RepID=A0A3N4U1X0_9RHOB|nr:3'(2'),5'-bisphosphate nucleotidase CysQ [Pacificibacter maritimus]RPE64836.1 myo-inositol-1(or 4)-monophosphatase [Pacificibacter maritimus]